MTDNLINQAKKMKRFEVRRQVEDNWMPYGCVPFDIHIKNNIATVSVIAETQDQAEEQVTKYIDRDDYI